MNKRQAKKIVQQLVFFKLEKSNYQPYSIPQQIMAFSHLGCRISEICEYLIYKIPIKYRHYDPRRLARAISIYQLQPTNAKEYDDCIRKLADIQKKLPPI